PRKHAEHRGAARGAGTPRRHLLLGYRAVRRSGGPGPRRPYPHPRGDLLGAEDGTHRRPLPPPPGRAPPPPAPRAPPHPPPDPRHHGRGPPRRARRARWGGGAPLRRGGRGRGGAGAVPTVIAFASRDGAARLYQGDSRSLTPIATGSVGIILTSPPYWITDESRAAAGRYARSLAVRFGPAWRRVLAPPPDLWLLTRDRPTAPA